MMVASSPATTSDGDIPVARGAPVGRGVHGYRSKRLNTYKYYLI